MYFNLWTFAPSFPSKWKAFLTLIFSNINHLSKYIEPLLQETAFIFQSLWTPLAQYHSAESGSHLSEILT